MERAIEAVVGRPPYHRCPYDGVHEPVCYASGARRPLRTDTRAIFCRTERYGTCPILVTHRPAGERSLPP